MLLAAPLALGVVTVLLALILFPQKATPGWRRVTPGYGYWLAFTLSWGLGLLIGWVWGLVGSSRPDGDSQMNIAWSLSLLFACGACNMGWRILSLHRLKLEWRGESLRWSGQPSIQMRELDRIASTFLGSTTLHFRSGARVAVDGAAARASELVEKIEDVNGLTPEDAPGEH